LKPDKRRGRFDFFLRLNWHGRCIDDANQLKDLRASQELFMSKVSLTIVTLTTGMAFLTGCQHLTKQSVVDKMATVEASQTQTLVNIKDVLDSNSETIPTLTAVGYAVTSTQPGRNEAQKRLMAIRSARMAAMRDLAEQIHGLKVDSSTTVIDLIVQNDTFRGVVNGTIRGARTVRINPTGTDTYEVVLEIDRETIAYLLKTARVAA
jgi:hypothetical protein